MDDDTLNPPIEGQESGPDVQDSIVDGQDQQDQGQDGGGEQEQQAQVDAPPPRQLTPEEIEERAFQRVASWMGRRERELQDNVLRNVTHVLDSRLSQFTPQVQPPAAPAIDPASFLDDPAQALRAFVPRILDEEISKRTTAETQYTSEIVKNSASIMDNSPLFADRELGQEVINEILASLPKMDRSIPPSAAARILVNESYANVVSKRMTKGNPFAGRQPVKGHGTITQPPAKAQPKAPGVKLDPVAARVAKWFGNTDEEVNSMLK